MLLVMQQNKIHNIAVYRAIIEVPQGSAHDQAIDETHPPLSLGETRELSQDVGTKSETDAQKEPALPPTRIRQEGKGSSGVMPSHPGKERQHLNSLAVKQLGNDNPFRGLIYGKNSDHQYEPPPAPGVQGPKLGSIIRCLYGQIHDVIADSLIEVMSRLLNILVDLRFECINRVKGLLLAQLLLERHLDQVAIQIACVIEYMHL